MKTKTADYILGFPRKKCSQTLGLHSQLPSLLWVMDTLPHRLSTAAEALLLQDEPTRALWRAPPAGEDGLPALSPAQMPCAGAGEPSRRPLS